ncbi:MAG: error-prone DNA polymerase, partial [Planctomycetota bacterium]|nr:error-prone DNA polymerase [Planctomycetota bacterium]
PEEKTMPGLTAQQALEKLTWEGAARRYPEGVPDKVVGLLKHELGLIETLRYAPYFLTVNAIVAFARSKDILCQGRGSAANSAVCFVLGITSIDPDRNNLLFERFVSQERKEPPDIDVDFEHERREIVMQWVYETYGRDHSALCSTVVRYHTKGAVRDIGKALGLPEDVTKLLSSQVWGHGEGIDETRARELNLNLADRRLTLTLELARQLEGTPRHLSQHPGGFVLTHDRLDELVPIEPARMVDRQVIEWDKDDIDILKFMKVDVLALGMLTCMKRSFDLLAEHKGVTLDLATSPAEDPATYAMIRKADTIGVFQIESRAQMSMLPRLKPRTFYDLVIEVAIVRPGPIQGGMVHPYLRRREGLETAHYPGPEIEEVLGRTLGVPLFQEQAMQLAIVAAKFTPDQADGLRRAMAAWKRRGGAIYRYGVQLIDGMLSNGYTREFAERCFEQIKGFSEYGFPESHAASFAILVYVSSWLKCHHPGAFGAALLNSQPMGFYQPAQIVRDLREHGVEVREVDVNRSAWDCTLEDEGRAVRLGMRLVRGLARREAEKIAQAARARGPFGSVESLWRASGVRVGSLRSLARADAFTSMGLDGRRALWQVKPLRDESLPLFAHLDATDDAGLEHLPAIGASVRVLHDYTATGLSLKAHPVSFVRGHLDACGAIGAGDLRSERLCPAKRVVLVGGVVICRQRPSTASGVTFMTLEDETGVANLIFWRDTFERYRRVARHSTMLLVRGTVERQGEVVHVHVRHAESLDEHLEELPSLSRDFH